MAALTAVERALVEHVERGVALDLAETETVDETAMRSWDESRTVRASVVRDILRGRLAPDPDPHGVRLRGARIAGRLDLEHITSTVALELRRCLLEQGVVARDADLPALDLSGSLLEHPHEAPVDADRLTTTVLALDHTVINAHNGRGAVRLAGAHLRGLDCTGATVRNNSGPALNADRLHVDQTAFLRGGFDAVGAGNAVAVDLAGVRVGGVLEFRPARLQHLTDPQFRLDVDGLSYIGLPQGISTDEWLRLLREGTPGYAAQPYQHLAAAQRVVLGCRTRFYGIKTARKRAARAARPAAPLGPAARRSPQ
jgi:hypothetical protein